MLLSTRSVFEGGIRIGNAPHEFSNSAQRVDSMPNDFCYTHRKCAIK